MNTSPTFQVPTKGIVLLAGDQGVQNAILAVQSDGKMILAGTVYGAGNADFRVVRLNADGTLDTTFNGTGKIDIAVAPNRHDSASSVQVLANGKIVIGGSSASSGANADFSVVRLNADGTLDTGFSSDGKVSLPVGQQNDFGYSVTVQSDGKTLMAGASYTAAGANFSVIRLNLDGSLDTSFNGTGKVIIPMPGATNAVARSVLVQSDGKIVLGGSGDTATGSTFSVARLNPDGSLDTTFSSDGKLNVAVGDHAAGGSLGLQADGKIVLGGQASDADGPRFAMVRLNTDGTLDQTFNATGVLSVAIDALAALAVKATQITVQANGKIVLAGSQNDGLDDDFSVIRVNPNGTLDNKFGKGGKLSIPVGQGSDGATSVVVRPDGKIVLAGAATGAVNGAAVVRLNADGSLDGAFNAHLAAGPQAALSYTHLLAPFQQPIVLSDKLTVYDAELAALNNGAGNYAGARVSLQRVGGANPDDVFLPGHAAFDDGKVLVGGVAVGQVSNEGGALTIYFNANASQKIVNFVLSNISYVNASIAPQASISLAWTFSDGFDWAAGTAGALAASGTTTLAVHPVTLPGVNFDPAGTLTVEGSVVPGWTLNVVDRLDDANGMGVVSYQWQADGRDIDGATNDTYDVQTSDAGKKISVLARYVDALGKAEQAHSNSVKSNYVSVDEHTRVVTHLVASDIAAGVAVKYVLSGDDADLFKVNGKGQLQFIDAPDFELADDADGDGVYQVHVTMTDAKFRQFEQTDWFIGVKFVAMNGTAGADTLKGSSGQDTMDGLAGNDKLTGGTGTDTFHISAGSDTIVDFNLLGDDSDEETLQVEAGAAVVATLAAQSWTATSASYNAGAAELRTKGLDVDLTEITLGHGWNVVNIGRDAVLIGSIFNDTLTAGAGNDELDGGDGDDLLIGTKLADTLTGGEGADHFRLNGIKGITTAHSITDFDSGEDVLELDLKVYKALGPQQVDEREFAYGLVATSTEQRLLYDRASGQLLYDADGIGKKAAVLIGVFEPDTLLHVTDIFGV